MSSDKVQSGATNMLQYTVTMSCRPEKRESALKGYFDQGHKMVSDYLKSLPSNDKIGVENIHLIIRG